MRGGFLLALLAAWATAGVAAAAPLRACTPPSHVAPAPTRQPPEREVVRDAPVASYVLALSWSPEWCRMRGGSPEARFQCRQNHLGFVVHGLWPNGPGKRHPRYCASAPPINAATVRRNYCMTPSADLLQHEWAAHGTCGWKTPEAYFDRARAMWNTIDAPSLAFPTGKQVTAGDIRGAFLARNRALRRNSLYIKVVDGNRLQEVRICHDLAFRPAPCRGGLGAPDHARVRIQH